MIYLADLTYEARPYATMVFSNKRKRKASPVPPTVTPSRRHSLQVDGEFLKKAFELAITDKKLHNKWFSAADWCSILPSYCTSLKGNETQVTTRKFTNRINQEIAHR